MSKAEYLSYHARVAARLRSLLLTGTTAAVKNRIMEKVKKHERLATIREPTRTGLDEPTSRIGSKG